MKRIRTLLSRLLILPLAALLFLGLGTRAAALSGAGAQLQGWSFSSILVSWTA